MEIYNHLRGPYSEPRTTSLVAQQLLTCHNGLSDLGVILYSQKQGVYREIKQKGGKSVVPTFFKQNVKEMCMVIFDAHNVLILAQKNYIGINGTQSRNKVGEVSCLFFVPVGFIYFF